LLLLGRLPFRFEPSHRQLMNASYRPISFPAP
jgi:hypothetical protein